MIFKLTTNYDKWKNGTPHFEIVNEAPCTDQRTNYSDGSSTLVVYETISYMSEVVELITPRMFENYTEYATFLITTEATLKAEKEK